MFKFESSNPHDDNPMYFDLVEEYGPNANGITERTVHVRHMSLDDMGEIVVGAVSVINPAMGDMLRGLLASRDTSMDTAMEVTEPSDSETGAGEPF